MKYSQQRFCRKQISFEKSSRRKVAKSEGCSEYLKNFSITQTILIKIKKKSHRANAIIMIEANDNLNKRAFFRLEKQMFLFSSSPSHHNSILQHLSYNNHCSFLCLKLVEIQLNPDLNKQKSDRQKQIVYAKRFESLFQKQENFFEIAKTYCPPLSVNQTATILAAPSSTMTLGLEEKRSISIWFIIIYRLMEIGNKYHKHEKQPYSHVLTLTQTPLKWQNANYETISNIGLKPKRSDTQGLSEVECEESTYPALSGPASQLVSQRRIRKGKASKEMSTKLSQSTSGSKHRNQLGGVKYFVRITDLMRLFFDKATMNSPFRSPISYDPYENEFNYSRHKLIEQIQNIHVPKIVQNVFITAQILYILMYIFVFPLSLLFEVVDQSDLCLALKIFGLAFSVMDILKLCRTVPHYERQNVSQQQYKRSINKLKNGIVTQVVIFILTLISLVSSQLNFDFGSFFFVGMTLNIKMYLNNIGKLQNHFFTASHREKYWDLIKVIGMNLLVGHILACALIAIASIHPEDSWMVTNHIISCPWWEQYIWSYYFGTTIILTIGFGDLHPGNFIEAFFIIIISFCACLFFGYNINYIGSLINLIKQEEVEKNDKLKVFNSLAKRTAVSKPTSQEITNYIIQSSKIRQEFNYAQERQLIQELPDGLKSSFLAEANLKLFNHLKTLISFTNKSIERLSLKIQTKICHPGQIIKKIGHPYSLMILQSGQVGYVARRKGSRLDGLVIQHISNTIDQQSKLICVDLLQNEPLNYDIKSLTYSTVYAMDKPTFEDCIRGSREDYETYKQALDSFRYKLNEFGILKCRFCEKQHNLFECPRLHFCPFKKSLPLRRKNLKAEERQKRVKFQRNKQDFNYYDYASAILFEQNMSYSGLSHSESCLKPIKKRVESKRTSSAHAFNPLSSRESFLFTMEMVTQIREDIQKLKVESAPAQFSFNLWEVTDCDEVCDFKSYFPKFNSSVLDQRYSFLAQSKNYKKKMVKRTNI